jgi:hypothetical protein
LRELFETGKVLRESSGRKGDPYLYSAPEKCLFFCSQDISGTRKQESKNGAYPESTERQYALREKAAEGNEQPFDQRGDYGAATAEGRALLQAGQREGEGTSAAAVRADRPAAIISRRVRRKVDN